MFFLNRTTRSGIVHNGGPIGGYDQTGNYKIDARYNAKALMRRIVRIGAYADRIEPKGEDGQDLLEDLARDGKRAERAFVYLDPPYYGKGRALYMNHFTPEQHKSLAAFLQGGPGFDWILTYDDVGAVRRLYKEFSLLRFSLSYAAYERRLGSELLVHPPSVSVTAEERIAFPFAAAKECRSGHSGDGDSPGRTLDSSLATLPGSEGEEPRDVSEYERAGGSPADRSGGQLATADSL